MDSNASNERMTKHEPAVCAVIQVEGNVQGVGFRPHVYRLASQHDLTGSVRNSLSGVELEVEGPRVAVEAFLTQLRRSPPPLATITSLAHEFREPRGQIGFLIHASTVEGDRTAQVAPDVSVCDDCLRELFDPNNRRHLYPFISCTNCGPRFSIIADLPYDRRNTSMSCFPMCQACQQEYEDPSSNRLHCQTNACWECGPKLWLQTAEDSGLPVISSVPERQLAAMEQAARLLQQGAIVAIKGIGGFHLACDATNPQAVETLRRRKHREAKPFALMVPDLESARRLCLVDEAAAQLLASPARPITLLPRRDRGTIAEAVASESRLLGLMLPYAPLHYTLLFKSSQPRFQALVMTSGNATDEPIAITNREALQKLGHLADAFLLHDRDILARADDSIVRCVSAETSAAQDMKSASPTRKTLVRRSRGYVPAPIRLAQNVGEVLAVGGHLKNTIAVSRGTSVFLSQHIGDLQNVEALESFKQATDHLQRILGVRPHVVAHDLHPDYLSTRYAQQLENVQLVPVQHHHAHVASCMAEHGLDGPVIGVVLDGTGLGTDRHIWGGEVLLADYDGFQRAAHLREVPLPGNEQAVKQPWRMALSYLDTVYGDRLWNLPIPFVRELERPTAELLLRATRQGINSPLTSSCGRLFDAVAALIGLRQINSYEGQAAMELESTAAADSCGQDVMHSMRNRTQPNVATPEREAGFPQISHQSLLLDQLPLIEDVITNLQARLPARDISRRFHEGLAHLFASGVERVADQSGISRIVLSGGCLQNEYLKREVMHAISRLGLQVYSSQFVPPNDGGLALGQIMVASRRVVPRRH